jgi:hypothetical protein
MLSMGLGFEGAGNSSVWRESKGFAFGFWGEWGILPCGKNESRGMNWGPTSDNQSQSSFSEHSKQV